MSKKIIPKNNIEITLLTKNHYQFKEELSKRMESGQEMINKEILNDSELNQLKTDYHDWNDYNSELLKSSFNKPKNEYRYRYDNCTNMIGLMEYTRGNYSPNDPSYQLMDTKRNIEAKVANLKQLFAKTDLIPTLKMTAEIFDVDKPVNKIFL